MLEYLQVPKRFPVSLSLGKRASLDEAVWWMRESTKKGRCDEDGHPGGHGCWTITELFGGNPNPDPKIVKNL